MNNARGCGRNSPTCSLWWCVERFFSQLFMSSLGLMKYCSSIWTGLLWAKHHWKCINVSHSHPWALQDYWGQDACESAGLGLSKVSKWFKEDDSQYKLVWLNYYFFLQIWIISGWWPCVFNSKRFLLLWTAAFISCKEQVAQFFASFPNIH